MTQSNDNTNTHSLNRDDLFLMMKSYENSISLNTTLLEQQKNVLDRQNDIISKQQELSLSIIKLIDKIENNFENIKDDNKRYELAAQDINHSIEELNKTLIEFKESCFKNYSDIEKLNIQTNEQISKGQTQIKFRIWYIYAGIITFLCSLIGSISTIMDKFDLIEKIAKHLGVS